MNIKWYCVHFNDPQGHMNWEINDGFIVKFTNIGDIILILI